MNATPHDFMKHNRSNATIFDDNCVKFFLSYDSKAEFSRGLNIENFLNAEVK